MRSSTVRDIDSPVVPQTKAAETPVSTRRAACFSITGRLRSPSDRKGVYGAAMRPERGKREAEVMGGQFSAEGGSSHGLAPWHGLPAHGSRYPAISTVLG